MGRKKIQITRIMDERNRQVNENFNLSLSLTDVNTFLKKEHMLKWLNFS